MRAQHHDHRRRLWKIVQHFESDANLHSKCFLWLVPSGSGYEAIKYKALAALFD